MTAQARETTGSIVEIPVVGIGVTQSITAVGASGTVWFVATGLDPAPDASSGNRIALAPDTGHYLKITPGDKVAAYDGSAGGAISNAVGATTTVVWVYYDSAAGTVYVTEMA